jgi:hypothetical protein
MQAQIIFKITDFAGDSPHYSLQQPFPILQSMYVPFLMKLDLGWQIKQPIIIGVWGSFFQSLQLLSGSHTKPLCLEESEHCSIITLLNSTKQTE